MSVSNIVLAITIWLMIGIGILGMYNNSKQISVLQKEVVELREEKISGWGNPSVVVLSNQIKDNR